MPLLNFVAIVLLVFVTSYIFIEMYNIKLYLDNNETQLQNLVSDINYNNHIIRQNIPGLGGTANVSSPDATSPDATTPDATTPDATRQEETRQEETRQQKR